MLFRLPNLPVSFKIRVNLFSVMISGYDSIATDPLHKSDTMEDVKVEVDDDDDDDDDLFKSARGLEPGGGGGGEPLKSIKEPQKMASSSDVIDLMAEEEEEENPFQVKMASIKLMKSDDS
jgi:hypothetical protein